MPDNDGDGEIDEDLAGGGDRDLPDPDPTRRSIDFPDFINHGKHDRAIGMLCFNNMIMPL